MDFGATMYSNQANHESHLWWALSVAKYERLLKVNSHVLTDTATVLKRIRWVYGTLQPRCRRRVDYSCPFGKHRGASHPWTAPVSEIRHLRWQLVERGL